MNSMLHIITIIIIIFLIIYVYIYYIDIFINCITGISVTIFLQFEFYSKIIILRVK